MSRTLSFGAAIELSGFRMEAAFEVAPGERLALVGSSGAGKSTCLRAIAGLATPSRGRIALGDRVLFDASKGVDLPPSERRVGLLFQDYALFPHLTAGANVAYGARARGMAAAHADQEARRWMERLGIVAFLQRRVTDLSGGQRQRVALARALASGAEVLLLDEPFAALDAITRAEVRTELRAFLGTVELPTVFVTHDPLDARVFGDRVAVVENGRISQTGPWESIAHAPRSALAAELTGINLYRARLDEGTGLRPARTGSIEFHVLADHASGEVHLAFRPDEVALSSEEPSGSRQNALRGRVVELLPIGDRVRVRLDAGVPVAADVTQESVSQLGIVPGREFWASVKATAIRVYG